MIRLLLAIVISPLFFSHSYAATMTFSGLSATGCYAATTYSEANILASGNGDITGWTNNGVVHLDDGGSSCASDIEFTMASRFNAVSFDVISGGFDTPAPYENIEVRGILNGTVIVEQFFKMSEAFGETKTFELGAAFVGLDRFSIRVLGNINYSCSPCGHFDLDNVVLAPVPLPASFPLMLVGLVGFGVWRRKRR